MCQYTWWQIIFLLLKLILYGLDHTVLNNPRVSYFFKSIKIKKIIFLLLKLILYGLDHTVLNNPRVSYFFKSIKINRPLAIRPKKYYPIICPETHGESL